jgi:hypothetical protein
MVDGPLGGDGKEGVEFGEIYTRRQGHTGRWRK